MSFGKRPSGPVPPAAAPAAPDRVAETEQLPAIVPTESGQLQTRAGFGVAAAEQWAQAAASQPVAKYTQAGQETPDYLKAKAIVIEELVSSLNYAALQRLPMDKRRQRVQAEAAAQLEKIELPLTRAQAELLQEQAIDELLGLGPLEPLLNDPDVADILINTAERVFIEKGGKLQLSDVKFLSERHLMGIIQRIVTRVGRRVDESSPMVDARLADGSRFNAIIPPLALDGALVSIRKFKKNKMPLRDYVGYDSMTPAMASFLEILVGQKG